MNVTVTRPFMLGGVRQELGATLELPEAFVRDLAHMGKVCPAEALPAHSGPMTTEAAAVLVKGKAKAKEENQ